MTGYFRDAIREQEDNPHDGLIRSLMEAEVDGERLSEEEVIANTIVTMVGGQETTTNLIGNGLLTLLRQPDKLAQLRDDPEIIDSAIEELLRYETPSQHTARIAPDDTMMGGKLISKGDGGDGGDGRRQSRSRALPRSRHARSDPHRQSPSRLRLGGAFLLRRAAWRGWRRGSRSPRCSRGSRTFAARPSKLEWRTNSGLRGLTALPITFRPAEADPMNAHAASPPRNGRCSRR